LSLRPRGRIAREPRIRSADRARAPPAPFRVQQRLSRAAAEPRGALLGSLSRRTARRDRGAARAPVLFGHAVPPRVQVAPKSSASAVHRVHRGRGGVRAQQRPRGRGGTAAAGDDDMKLFLDTAVYEEIKQGVDWGVVDGVTTNPTLIAKAGHEHEDQVKRICQIIGNVSAEVVSEKRDDMIAEGRRIASWHEDVMVKVRTTRGGGARGGRHRDDAVRDPEAAVQPPIDGGWTEALPRGLPASEGRARHRARGLGRSEQDGSRARDKADGGADGEALISAWAARRAACRADRHSPHGRDRGRRAWGRRGRSRLARS